MIIIWKLWKHWRFEKDARVIYGKVMDSERGMDKQNRPRLSVHYRFQSPKTQQFIEDQRVGRRSIEPSELPPAGSPVAIRYLDDRKHILL